MKLQSLLAAAVALTLSTGLRAQDSDQDVPQHQQPDTSFSLTHGLDASGVDFYAENGFVGGYVALLVSSSPGSAELPGALGGAELGLFQPILFALDTSAGDYHVAVDLDLRTLAEFGITAYVQAVAFERAADDDEPEGDVIATRISEVVAIDFAAELASYFALQNAMRDTGDNDTEGDGDGDRDASDRPSPCRCEETRPTGEDNDR